MIVLASSNVPSWVVLLIVIGIFVVIGGVAFIIYFLLKRKAPKEEKPVETKKTYVVKPGDTLWGIAKTYLGSGLKYPQIKKANNLTSDTIYVGQKLIIP